MYVNQLKVRSRTMSLSLSVAEFRDNASGGGLVAIQHVHICYHIVECIPLDYSKAYAYFMYRLLTLSTTMYATRYPATPIDSTRPLPLVSWLTKSVNVLNALGFTCTT